MKIFWIDRDGWWDWEESIEALEDYLECIAVSENEYIIVDEECFVYDYRESKNGINNFVLSRSSIVNKELIPLIQGYKEGAKIAAIDLKILHNE